MSLAFSSRVRINKQSGMGFSGVPKRLTSWTLYFWDSSSDLISSWFMSARTPLRTTFKVRSSWRFQVLSSNFKQSGAIRVEGDQSEVAAMRLNRARDDLGESIFFDGFDYFNLLNDDRRNVETVEINVHIMTISFLSIRIWTVQLEIIFSGKKPCFKFELSLNVIIIQTF